MVQAAAWREVLLARGGRDAALLLRKWGREALRKENIRPGLRFKAGAAAAAGWVVVCHARMGLQSWRGQFGLCPHLARA